MTCIFRQMKKSIACTVGVLSCLALNTMPTHAGSDIVQSPNNSDLEANDVEPGVRDLYRNLRREFNLSINEVPRSGVNLALPPISYDIYKVFDPTRAKSVHVLGLIQSEGRTLVMFKYPNESVPFFSAVGDTLYNGDVKVKKVTGVQTSLPIVLLDEDGIEVHRNVGDRSASK
jgi:hypothetical protein